MNAILIAIVASSFIVTSSNGHHHSDQNEENRENVERKAYDVSETIRLESERALANVDELIKWTRTQLVSAIEDYNKTMSTEMQEFNKLLKVWKPLTEMEQQEIANFEDGIQNYLLVMKTLVMESITIPAVNEYYDFIRDDFKQLEDIVLLEPINSGQ